jgi:hypothetical protein
MKHSLRVCVAALSLAACNDPLVDPQTVIGLRILGAKLTAPGEPSVARVSPGETGTLSWLVASDREADYEALALFCKARPGTFGVPHCDGAFHEQEAAGTSTGQLSFPIELPSAFLEDQQWLGFLALCQSGEPRWNNRSQRFSCTSNDEPITAIYQSFWHANENHNPNLTDDRLHFDGKPWAAVDAASCDNPEVPRLSRSDVSRVQFGAKGDDSEALDVDSYAAASREALTYLHVATTAGLSRAFSALDPTEKDRTFELEVRGEDAWADVQKQTLGTFYLVVTDGRGGSDWLERRYCVTR